MNFQKFILSLIIGILLVQICTYYLISRQELIKEIGLHHETFVFDNEENLFKEVNIISRLNPTEKQVSNFFSKFENRKVKICTSLVICPEISESKLSLVYVFDIGKGNPFVFNTIDEVELGPEFVATWKSKYIWILFKWVFIEKNNTYIS